jgi:hypothetical protein
LEDAVWEVVANLLSNPEKLREGLDDIIEAERAERRGDPEEKERAWLDNRAAVDFKRARFQDMAAEGHITFDELGAKLGELKAARQTAERELALVRGRREVLEGLERDRDAIMESYAGIMVPETLNDLSGEERHQVYRMLRPKVHVGPDGDLDIRGAIRPPESTPPEGSPVCTSTGTRPCTRGRTGSCSGGSGTEVRSCRSTGSGRRRSPGGFRRETGSSRASRTPWWSWRRRRRAGA